jgi:hypothetical protein
MTMLKRVGGRRGEHQLVVLAGSRVMNVPGGGLTAVAHDESEHDIKSTILSMSVTYRPKWLISREKL